MLDRELIRTSAVVGIGNVISRVLGFVFFALVARAFSTGDYGFIRYSITIATLASVISTTGFPTALSKFISEYRGKKEANAYYSNCLAVIALLLLLTLTVVPLIIGLNIGVLAVIAGLTIYFTYFGALRGFLAYKKIALFAVTNSFLRVILVIALFFFLDDVLPLWILIIFAFTCLIPLSVIELISPIKAKFRKELISKETIKKLWKFALPVTVGAIAFNLLTGIGIIAVQYFLDYEKVGIYSVAITLTIIFTFTPLAITTMLMPRIAGIKSEKEIARLLKHSLIITLLISLALFTAVLFFGEFFIAFIFTERYIKAFDVLLILSFGMLFSSLYTILTSAWEGKGKPQIPMQVMVSVSVIGVISTVILTPLMGIVGAGISLTLARIIAFSALSLYTLLWKESLFS